MVTGYGGYCKFCVMFPPSDQKLYYSVLLKRPFKNLLNAKGVKRVLGQHENTHDFKHAVLKYKDSKQLLLKPSQHVNYRLDRRKNNDMKKMFTASKV